MSRQSLRSERKLRQQVAGAAPVPLLTLEPDSTVIRANEAAKLLLAHTWGLEGCRLVDCVAAHDQGTFRDHVTRAFETEGWQTCDLELSTASGTTFNARLTVVASPLIAPTARNPAAQYGVAVLQDISARDALVSELADKNSELERFVYTVSHDLKSPLITMKGFAAMLREDVEQGDERRVMHDLERIEAAADHMGKLLDALLALSRVGRTVSDPEPVPLGPLVEAAIDRLRAAIDEKGARVTIAAGLPVVQGDRIRLSEVMQNLIENALKFSGLHDEPLIEVGHRRDGHETIVFVRDEGIGIDPQHHGRVFELFDKLDPGIPGTGVGLAIAKRVIEKHGGRIWVESAGLGRGATICFTLPAGSAGDGGETHE